VVLASLKAAVFFRNQVLVLIFRFFKSYAMDDDFFVPWWWQRRRNYSLPIEHT